METEIHWSSRWHFDIYAHTATATLLSLTFPTDQQTPSGPCGWILRYKLWWELGAKRESTAAVVLLGGFPLSETSATCMICPANTYLQQRSSTECLSARWNTILWHVGSNPPCLSLSSVFLTAPGHGPCYVGPSKCVFLGGCFQWEGCKGWTMHQHWTERVMFSLGSHFLQDKCSWQGSMGRAFLSALVSRGSPRTIWALPNLLPTLRHRQDGHLPL